MDNNKIENIKIYGERNMEQIFYMNYYKII